MMRLKQKLSAALALCATAGCVDEPARAPLPPVGELTVTRRLPGQDVDAAPAKNPTDSVWVQADGRGIYVNDPRNGGTHSDLSSFKIKATKAGLEIALDCAIFNEEARFGNKEAEISLDEPDAKAAAAPKSDKTTISTDELEVKKGGPFDADKGKYPAPMVRLGVDADFIPVTSMRCDVAVKR